MLPAVRAVRVVHVQMEVTARGAALEFDCATGTITEPLPVDSQGPFKVKGTFTREHGGPSRDRDASFSADATYSGTIKDDTMALRIVIEGKERQIEDYVLVRGRQGNVRKCR